MNHRERFLAVLHGGQPDRIPILANLTIQPAQKLAQQLQLDVEFVDSFLATRISHQSILLALGNDAVIVAATRGQPTRELPGSEAQDEWGLVSRNVGFYGEAVRRPLAHCDTVKDVEAFAWPDPEAPSRWQHAQAQIAKYCSDYAIVGDLEACIFELAWNLVGFEKFLLDFAAGEAYIDALLDRVMQYSIACGLRLIDMGVDMIWAGDDFGTQKGMLISPQAWRTHFKPRYRQMFSALRKANPDIRVAYHSCGSIVPILEDYIDAGVDFINPLQPGAAGMELGELYRRLGTRIGFFGGVDVQGVLPHGTPQQVRAEVRRCMDAVEHSNRYIIAPAHNIQPDTSVENILAFFDEAIRYGVRPLADARRGDRH